MHLTKNKSLHYFFHDDIFKKTFLEILTKMTHFTFLEVC
jgi:hypothetical protein